MCELQFENLSINHGESLLNIWADEEVIRYTNMKLPCTIEDVRNRIEIFQPFDVFAVIRKGELIGIIGCPPIDKNKLQFGVFYQFRKSAWGQGNATMAVKWLLEYMQQKYKNAALFADVVSENTASEKILQNFGFQYVSEELTERNGIQLNVHNYKL